MPSSFHSNHVSSEPDDYIGREFLVTIQAGETKATFSIPIVNDNIFELDENFFLTLEIPQPAVDIGVKRGDPHMATVTITNDERECSIATYPHFTIPHSPTLLSQHHA